MLFGAKRATVSFGFRRYSNLKADAMLCLKSGVFVEYDAELAAVWDTESTYMYAS